MAIKDKKGSGYFCSYCEKKYSHPQAADQCRDSHDLIYIALTKEDLNRLLMFLQLKQDELLTRSLVKSLTKVRR
jgi:hypothetical protein